MINNLSIGYFFHVIIYLVVFVVILVSSRAIKWDKLINPKYKIETLVIYISICIGLAYLVGSFINAIIPIN